MGDKLRKLGRKFLGLKDWNLSDSVTETAGGSTPAAHATPALPGQGGAGHITTKQVGYIYSLYKKHGDAISEIIGKVVGSGTPSGRNQLYYAATHLTKKQAGDVFGELANAGFIPKSRAPRKPKA